MSTPAIHCAFDELVRLDDLVPNPKNPNTHPKKQIKLLAKIFKENGVRRPITVSKRTGVMTVGHGRLEAARICGMEFYPVDYQDYDSDEHEMADMLADNRIPELAEMDLTLLEENKGMLEIAGFDLEIAGFEGDGTDGSGIDEEKLDNIPLLPKTSQAKTGDIWQIGDHILMCGDSSSSEDVLLLMGESKADMCFTDPPYGVSYNGVWHGKNKVREPIQNDSVTGEKLADLCEKWFNGVDLFTKDGAYIMATVPQTPITFELDWKKRGWLRQILVWNKSSFVLGRSEYHYKHELILFGWKPGNRLKNDDRKKHSVWEFDRPTSSKEHPTMKPVKMWEYGIGNHTEAGDLIYEPFSGSGTTMVACQNTGRRCYSMEIDPIYVDVALQRMCDVFGLVGVEKNTGREFIPQ